MYHRAAVAAAALAIPLALAGRAEAHVAGVSQSAFALGDGSMVRAELVFALADAAALSRGDEAPMRDAVLHAIDVRADGDACDPKYEGTAAQGDALAVRASFACPHRPRELDVSLPLLDELPASHAHLIRVTSGGDATQTTLRSGAQHAKLSIGGALASPSFARAATRTLALGVEHVALGWDHLLFVLALALRERRLRSLAMVVTAFTVAHSITLALAALDVVEVSARIVEPAIAASIAVVAADYALARVRRVAVAFACGLLHGFGFAAGLRALGLPASRIVPALLGFNVGVELGQLVAVVVFVGALALGRRHAATRAHLDRRLSIAVALVGAALCVARLAGARL